MENGISRNISWRPNLNTPKKSASWPGVKKLINSISKDLESREYNGRWYTDVKAWKVSREGTNADNAYSNTSQHHYTQQDTISPTLDDDEIPF